MTAMLSIEETAATLNLTQRHVRRMCTNGELKGAVKSGKGWMIPETAAPELCARSVKAKLDDCQLANVPADKKEEALWRLGIVKQFEGFAANYMRNGGGRVEARKAFVGMSKGVTERTLHRWCERYKNEGLIGLVDTRGKTAGSFISDGAWEAFKSMFLDQRQLSVKTCLANVSYMSRAGKLNWQIPSLRTMQRLVKDRIPLYAMVLHREGLAAYEAKCAPYIERDPDSVQPGQVWIGDHHQFNCWVRYRNKWARPWVTAWEDMRSRKIVGWHVSTSPNQTTILLACRRGLEVYGPPDMAKIDNGKDYDSEMWTGTTKARRRELQKGYIDEAMVAGLYAMMDVAVSFAIPYHPQSKPVERFFDTLDRQFTKTFQTYCGKDSARKPDYLNDLLKNEKTIATAVDLDEFTGLLERYIEIYNNTAHSGSGMEGSSPAAVMATRTSRRVLPDGVIDLLCRVWSGNVTVGKNGVKFNGIWYGQYDMELAAYQGKQVRLAYDPDDLRQVWVYDAATLKLIAAAEQRQLVAYGKAVAEDDLREAMKKKNHAVKVARQYKTTRLDANMDLTTLTLKAMEEATQESPQQAQQHLRPVATPLNGQQREHDRRHALKYVRRAAGAENTTQVLDIDFSVLGPKETAKLNFDFER